MSFVTRSNDPVITEMVSHCFEPSLSPKPLLLKAKVHPTKWKPCFRASKAIPSLRHAVPTLRDMMQGFTSLRNHVKKENELSLET